ncbi:hypothetical protein T484DRAFT_1879869 [Baffinella frigidus]|nr:hypothetical protein T484DRAFT_1879869 [Cryptophyta sp. CCMP2293]
MRLDAVKAVVTGAGGGLGRTFSRELLKAGAKVMATDIDAKGLEETQRMLGGVHTHLGDVTQEEDVETLFAKARELMGGCNLLVNNAGVLRDKSLVRSDKATGKGVKNMSKKDWDIVLNVNLTGLGFRGEGLALRV